MEEKLKKKTIVNKVLLNLIILIVKIIIIIFLFFVIFTKLFGIIRITTEDMAPSIRDGDFIIYYRLDNNYEVGDVVVVKLKNKKYVYRIGGLPGDSIDITADNSRLLINKAPEEHITYYKTIKDDSKKISFPYQVEENHYFVINDYRTRTNDSRKFGAVNKNKILGKVIGKLQSRNI